MLTVIVILMAVVLEVWNLDPRSAPCPWQILDPGFQSLADCRCAVQCHERLLLFILHLWAQKGSNARTYGHSVNEGRTYVHACTLTLSFTPAHTNLLTLLFTLPGRVAHR